MAAGSAPGLQGSSRAPPGLLRGPSSRLAASVPCCEPEPAGSLVLLASLDAAHPPSSGADGYGDRLPAPLAVYVTYPPRRVYQPDLTIRNEAAEHLAYMAVLSLPAQYVVLGPVRCTRPSMYTPSVHLPCLPNSPLATCLPYLPGLPACLPLPAAVRHRQCPHCSHLESIVPSRPPLPVQLRVIGSWSRYKVPLQFTAVSNPIPLPGKESHFEFGISGIEEALGESKTTGSLCSYGVSITLFCYRGVFDDSP